MLNDSSLVSVCLRHGFGYRMSMGAVEVVRSFAVAPFVGGTVVLNLATGTYFHLDADVTPIALGIARDLPPAEIEEQMATLRKIPRYVARERVRALQLQLASPFSLASSPRLGSDSFVEVAGSVQITEEAGILRPGDTLALQGAALRTPEGLFFIGGARGAGKTVVCSALAQRGLDVIDDGLVKLPVQRGRISTPLSQAWFLESRRRSGMGLILARRNAPFVMAQLLSHTRSSHARGAWVEIFKIYARLAEELPSFRVTVPEGVPAVQQAVRDFTGGFGFRPEGPRVGC